MDKIKLSISAVVVTKNEATYLARCLEGIDYCDEIIVVDLNSTDDSVEIAMRLGAKVIRHREEPFVELVHQNIKDWVRNQWVIITDPDEVANAGLKDHIIRNFDEWKNRNDVGSIRAPMVYYVGQKKFSGTSWGPTNKSRVYLVNLNRYEFTGVIHKGRKLKEGFRELFIEHRHGHLDHYWVGSLTELVNKCKRYLSHEKGDFVADDRMDIINYLKFPISTFYSSFFVRKGYKDGLLGLQLSAIFSWYSTACFVKKRRNKTGG